MAIEGIGAATNSPLPAPPAPAIADALKTPAQKLADARAEANAGINDGDEGSTKGAQVNTTA